MRALLSKGLYGLLVALVVERENVSLRVYGTKKPIEKKLAKCHSYVKLSKNDFLFSVGRGVYFLL
jgi:hypothetical protein